VDGIWVSKPIGLTIDAAQPKLPLGFDFGMPGKPSLVRCIDSRGAAAIGARAMLVTSAGPFAETLLPRSYRSDGAGAVHLPPLEADTHFLKFVGHAMRVVE
jgi:hypothetical protein